jgi:FAD/FMN-containing dehydrogenase
MLLTDNVPQKVHAVVRALQKRPTIACCLEENAGYEDARRIWNAAVAHRPAVIVRCASSGDVAATIQAASEHGLPVSVRAGGHDWAGRAIRHGAVVIDLRPMKAIHIDPSRRVATIGCGVTAAEVAAEATKHGLAAVTGSVGRIGLSGLVTGGGYGPLLGLHGLALDNLLGAEVVLADGRVVTADADNERELYWAIRGGGGNFGVLTSMRLALHPLGQVLAGFMLFDWRSAAATWTRLAEYLVDCPEALYAQTGVVPGPNGAPLMMIQPSWAGDLTAGERVMERLRDMGPLVSSNVKPMTYLEMLSMLDELGADGLHYDLRTRNIARFEPGNLAALIEAGTSRTSPLTSIPINHFYGAATRVPLEATAFGERRPHHVVFIVATWADGDPDPERHRRWTREASAALAPHAMPGGYVNVLAPGDDDRAREAFGHNAPRLLAAKRAYDPDGVFSGIPLGGISR